MWALISCHSARNTRHVLHTTKYWRRIHALSTAACDWIVRAIEWARRRPRSQKCAAIAEPETDAAIDEIPTQ